MLLVRSRGSPKTTDHFSARSEEKQSHTSRQTICSVPAVVFKLTYRLQALAAMALLTAILAGCGGGSSSSGNAGTSSSSSTNSSKGGASTSIAKTGTAGVVAQVGETPITRATVSHWMQTLAGGDYLELSHNHTIPSGLVSDPPNYGACVSHLEAAVSKGGIEVANRAAAQVLPKCRELNQALRIQAVSYLVNAQWTIQLYRENGITASDAEVMQLFKTTKAREFPTEAKLKQYLARRHRTLADEMFVLKLDLLSQKIEQILKARGNAEIVALTGPAKKITAQTVCQPGYVVRHCNQFNESAPPPSTPSPAILMEQLATLLGVHCVNLPACASK